MARSLMIIGGSGFFGKSILDAYARGLLAPWDVNRLIVVARHASSLLSSHPALVGPTIQLVDADVSSAAILPSTDYVIHAASTTDARRYAENPARERANILASVENYIRIARAAHRDSQIVYTSSGAVYGQQPADLEFLSEDVRPGSATGLVAYKRDYAEAKRLAEERMAALGGEGIAVAVARCFAFIGLHLPRDQHFAIGNFIGDGHAGRPVTVHATQPVYRSYMHADDLVRWLMTIAAHAAPSCPIYNVGSPEALTMGEAAQIVADQFGVAVQVPTLRDGAVDRYVPSVAKAELELGLRLDYDLSAAVRDVAARLRVGLP